MNKNEISEVPVPVNYNLLKSITVKMMALERTILNSPQKDEYLKNKEFWTTALDSKFEETFQQLLSENQQ